MYILFMAAVLLNGRVKECDRDCAKSLQACLTLCDPMDCSLPGFSVHGILQARTLEWVAISFSRQRLYEA